jgi:hypothetical protein
VRNKEKNTEREPVAIRLYPVLSYSILYKTIAFRLALVSSDSIFCKTTVYLILRANAEAG